MDDIYDIQVKDSLKKDISLSEYSGKTLLVVNVASKCLSLIHISEPTRQP